MDKVRDLIKNERHEEYLKLLKDKVNEIVDFVNSLTAVDLTDPRVYVGRRDEDGD